jgi:hypothetical protein
VRYVCEWGRFKPSARLAEKRALLLRVVKMAQQIIVKKISGDESTLMISNAENFIGRVNCVKSVVSKPKLISNWISKLRSILDCPEVEQRVKIQAALLYEEFTQPNYLPLLRMKIYETTGLHDKLVLAIGALKAESPVLTETAEAALETLAVWRAQLKLIAASTAPEQRAYLGVEATPGLIAEIFADMEIASGWAVTSYLIKYGERAPATPEEKMIRLWNQPDAESSETIALLELGRELDSSNRLYEADRIVEQINEAKDCAITDILAKYWIQRLSIVMETPGLDMKTATKAIEEEPNSIIFGKSKSGGPFPTAPKFNR